MHGGRCSHLRYRGRLTQRLRPTTQPRLRLAGGCTLPRRAVAAPAPRRARRAAALRAEARAVAEAGRPYGRDRRLAQRCRTDRDRQATRRGLAGARRTRSGKPADARGHGAGDETQRKVAQGLDAPRLQQPIAQCGPSLGASKRTHRPLRSRVLLGDARPRPPPRARTTRSGRQAPGVPHRDPARRRPLRPGATGPASLETHGGLTYDQRCPTGPSPPAALAARFEPRSSVTQGTFAWRSLLPTQEAALRWTPAGSTQRQDDVFW